MKSKRERFETVATKRVQYILDKLELLGNCANRNNYEYGEEDVRKMFVVIKEHIRKTEIKFGDEIAKKTKSIFKF